MNIFDLINQDMAAATTKVTLGKDPTSGKEFGFVCVGLDSPQWLGELEAQRVEGLKYVREHGAIDANTDEGAALVKKRFDEGQIRQALAVTVDWFGLTDGEGNPAPFDREMARKMLTARPTWVDSVMAGISKAAAFFPQSKAGS